jgi:hypothetical protein
MKTLRYAVVFKWRGGTDAFMAIAIGRPAVPETVKLP